MTERLREHGKELEKTVFKLKYALRESLPTTGALVGLLNPDISLVYLDCPPTPPKDLPRDFGFLT